MAQRDQYNLHDSVVTTNVQFPEIKVLTFLPPWIQGPLHRLPR